MWIRPLIQQQAGNRHEGVILGVGGAVIVGDATAVGHAIQCAQHKVNGGKAANAVAVLNGGNLVVKVFGVAAPDSGHQVVVGGFQVVAARRIHHKGVAKVWADMGEIDGGDKEQISALGFAAQGIDHGR